MTCFRKIIDFWKARGKYLNLVYEKDMRKGWPGELMENKFSIVMPVYNAEEYLQRSLSHVDALLEQLRPSDLLVVRFGRPQVEYTEEFMAAAEAFRKRQITLRQALERTGIKKSSFYYHLKRLAELGLIAG